MSGRVTVVKRRVAPRRRRGAVVDFLGGEHGGATVDYVVVTGLVAAVSVMLLLNLSSGTSNAATGISDDLSRGGALAIASREPQRSDAGGRTWQTVPGQSGSYGYASGSSSAGSSVRAPSPVSPEMEGGAGPSLASAAVEAPAGGGAPEYGDRQARAEDPAPAPSQDAPAAPATGNGQGNGKGNGNAKGIGNGKGNGAGSDDHGDDDVAAAACGLGKGNASSTANANASDRARQAAASAC